MVFPHHNFNGGIVAILERVAQDVDLLAIFPNGSEEIYEIKTTNSSNLSHQLRSGFAQVLEYRYRRQKEIGSSATCYLAIDRPVVDDWQKEFMFHHGVRLVGAENFTPL